MSDNPILAKPVYDLLIRGGQVIDGTGVPRRSADVAVLGDRIAAVGDLSRAKARQTLDASGKIVAPGFIDSHTHDDAALLTQPDMVYKISQGVTTVVTGNCGISIAPITRPGALPAPLDLLDTAEHLRFRGFADFAQALERTPASVNVAALIGHSTLRFNTMESLDQPATERQVATMRDQLAESLAAGAIGLSTGTFYPPAAAASIQEIIEVARPLSAPDGIYATHMRDEADHSMESLEETFQIGRALGVRVVVSHHKLKQPRNFGRSAVTLPFIEAAMQQQRISLDCYPYNASSTTLHVDEERLQGRVMVASSGSHPECDGKDLDAIAASWGVTRLAAARRLQPASAIYFCMDEGDVQRILTFGPTMIGSDGLPVGDTPHPRLWGTFPRVLGHYSRDLGLFPLETAVWKMTGLTALSYGFADRGGLQAGKKADIVVFDAATVSDRATYQDPVQPAAGIESVWVNGTLTWRDGVHLGAHCGQLIRGSRR